MHRLAHVSLRNRSFVALVCVVAAILGGISLSSMRQELIPQVELPAVSVVAISAGATAEQISDRIAVPIEQQVSTIAEVSSTTTNSSSSYAMITVELEYGTDLARATAKIEQAVDTASDTFPENTTTQVTSGGTSDIPLAMIGVTTSGDAASTADKVRTDVLPRLEKLDGVASAQLIGAPEQEVTISLDQEAMLANGVEASAIATALDNNGLSIPVGTVAHEGNTLDVTVGQSIDSIDGLKALPVAATNPVTGESGTVTLGDIADVAITAADSQMVSRIDGSAAVALIIYPTANANIIDTSRAVSAELDSVRDSLGDVSFTTIFDQAPFITTSINSLAEEGALGLVMAVVVILLFLMSLRSTIVTAISIPLSLLLAFIGMNVAGYSLNILTLSALTISIGRVVDDSIVVIENIKRHLEYGEAKRRAILMAVREVASAVTSSTIVTCLVFIPVGLVSGMTGELFKPFALTVVLAMAASLFTSLTIVPVLAYWFLRPSKEAREAADAISAVGTVADVLGTQREDDREARVAELITKRQAEAEAKEKRTWLRRSYRPVLRSSQRHPVITLCIAVAILVASGALIPLLKINLLGNTGQNMVSLSQQVPAGTSTDSMVERAATSEKALENVAGVESVATIIGGAGIGASSTSAISYTVTTDPDADQEAITDSLEDALQAVVPPEDSASALDSTSLSSSTIEINVVAGDDDALADANEKLLAALDGVEGAKSITSNLDAAQPAVQVTVNRDAVSAVGLTENDVVGLISAQMVSASIGTVTIDNTDLNIYIELADPVTSLDQLQNMTLMGQPIAAFATVEEVTVVPTVVTINGQQTATITVTPENTDDLGSVRSAVNGIVADTDLPAGASTTEAGAGEQISDTFSQLGLAMAAAILLIYVVLVWILKSLVQPVLLLVSIPFAAIGAFLALFATGTPLGISSLIGILMLIGIVVTNAIVLMDLINQYRRRGMPLDEAIDKGAQRRVRPIIMTALATIAAMAPMALGITGAAGFISQPLAITVIGGLVSSTLLTLVLLPVLYRLTQKKDLAEIETADRDE
ncbi:efflux RND transporter permease subunit [Changpingibacter yushuensis]|uniref:efflux RND transporter permease subunit n=1 Tax=Changpingibacter yushuensis TaxID=2758440 RepID=UPI00165E03AD|nr:efflux RND transporter permease subunit [Changpingibacter yushuensis]